VVKKKYKNYWWCYRQ